MAINYEELYPNKKICVICYAQFQPKSTTHMTCSAKCSKANSRDKQRKRAANRIGGSRYHKDECVLEMLKSGFF